jgi:phage FluMu protein Com
MSAAKTIADVDFGNTTPWCSHCENVFPLTARVSLDGGYLLVQCPSCSHITPFKKAVKA